MGRDKSKGLKSAYELALERLEDQGIERPQSESLSAVTREEMAEVRRQAAAKLAELEIMHRDHAQRVIDPEERQKAEERYLQERQEIEAGRDRKIAKLRT